MLFPFLFYEGGNGDFMAKYKQLTEWIIKNYEEMTGEVLKSNSTQLDSLRTILKTKIDQLNILHIKAESVMLNMSVQEKKGSFRQGVLMEYTNLENSQKKITQNELDNIIFQIRKILIDSYKIIMNLREIITGEKIKYSLGDTYSNKSIEIESETIYNKAKLSIALSQTNNVINDFNITLRLNSRAIIEDSQKKESEILNSINGEEGSTLWSQGIKVQTILRGYYNYDPNTYVGFGINKGHFYEAYLHYTKVENRNNFSGPFPTNLEYAKLMLSLLNNKPFYKGGDIGEYQAKINSASLVNSKTLLKVLQELYNILGNEKGRINKNIINKLKAQFTDDIDVSVSKVIDQKTQELLKNIFPS